jgi:hypothetical protein
MSEHEPREPEPDTRPGDEEVEREQPERVPREDAGNPWPRTSAGETEDPSAD